MENNKDERYENLKKSVNNAVKILCNKSQDLKSEMKELKKGKVNDKKNPCDCQEKFEEFRDLEETKIENEIGKKRRVMISKYI